MLPPALRMRSAGDFTSTSRRGRRVAASLCVVHALVDSQSTDRRVGVVVSRAVGNSVARHRAARRIRAAVREVVPELPAGIRLVVRALPGSDTSPGTGAEVRQAIRSALELSTR